MNGFAIARSYLNGHAFQDFKTRIFPSWLE